MPLTPEFHLSITPTLSEEGELETRGTRVLARHTNQDDFSPHRQLLALGKNERAKQNT
jgi:hypothetical protein